MRLILARVLWNFDLELQPDSQTWPLQKVGLAGYEIMNLCSDYLKVWTLWEKTPLHVKLIPRKF
jgi:hypothetical protein